MVRASTKCEVCSMPLLCGRRLCHISHGHVLCRSPTLVRRCRNRRNGLNYGLDASGQRLSEAYLEAVVMRRLSELNRSRTDHPHRMSERDRRDFIANVLFTRVSTFQFGFFTVPSDDHLTASWFCRVRISESSWIQRSKPMWSHQVKVQDKAS